MFIVVLFHGNSMIDVLIIQAKSATEAYYKAQQGDIECDEMFMIDGFFGVGGFARGIDMSECPTLIPEKPRSFVEWCVDKYVMPILPLVMQGGMSHADLQRVWALHDRCCEPCYSG